jgi:hypothetical protein
MELSVTSLSRSDNNISETVTVYITDAGTG